MTVPLPTKAARAEDCLKAVLRRSAESGGPVAPGALARELGMSAGGVTALVKSLAEEELVRYRPYKGVRLTDSGHRRAVEVLRRHRLLELFLVEVLGMDWSEVHGEAEKLEHVISDRLVDRLDETLGHPRVDPHGDPIPCSGGKLAENPANRLSSCEERLAFRVCRIEDQSSEFLGLVDRLGLRPGSRVQVAKRSHAAATVELRIEEKDPVSLGMQAASKILVEAI